MNNELYPSTNPRGDIAKTFSAPFYCVYELTSRCNQRCRHCYGKFPRAEAELDTKKTLKVINELRRFGVFRIELGGGEIAMRQDLTDIFRHIGRYDDVEFTLVTNGTLWTQKLLDSLTCAKGNISSVHISMDGHDESSYALLRRQPDGFNHALRTTHEMKKRGVEVRWNFAVGPKTLPHLRPTLELARTHGVSEVRLMLLYEIGRAGVAEGYGFSFNQLKAFLVSYIEEGMFARSKLSVVHPMEVLLPLIEAGYSRRRLAKLLPYIQSPLENPYFREQTDLGCGAGRTLCSITAAGDLHFCCLLTSAPEMRVGNILDENLESLWHNSERMRWVRSIRLADIKGPCLKCDFRDLCGGGCRARAYFTYGDYLAPDPLCPFSHETGNGKSSEADQQLSPIGFKKPILIDGQQVKELARDQAFTVQINGQKIRVRREHFGASALLPDKTYRCGNHEAYIILSLLHFLGDPFKVSEAIALSVGIPKNEAEKKVKNLLDELTGGSDGKHEEIKGLSQDS